MLFKFQVIKEIFSSTKMFSLCIAGSVWIYSMHPPSYDPRNQQNYCNKTLYLFAFWLNTVCYGCLAVLLLCSGCLVLYICVQNTCQRPQSSASNSQQQAWDFLECMSLYLADALFKSTYRALYFINMLPENQTCDLGIIYPIFYQKRAQKSTFLGWTDLT